jgi:hypothetical protein
MLEKWTLVACSAVNLYLLGVMMLFAAVVYPQFGSVERGAFPPLYAAFNGRIGVPVVAFEFLSLLLTVALYALRPAEVPLWAVHAAVGLGVAYFVITFGFHLPSHRALAAGDNSAQALAPLLSSQWARTVVQVLRAGLLSWLSVLAMTRG